MSPPLISIIIPTHNRPHLLPRAVQSALSQTLHDIEVIVVDDGSNPPAQLADDPKLRMIRLEPGRGGASARNAGTQAARGRWVTYLDDDDCLLPTMAEVSLRVLESSSERGPLAVLSGLQVVDEQGEVLRTRIPPARCPQGSHFFLEQLEPGCSFHTKQTLVVERDLVLSIGGWDESFRSRVHSEFFLRLNPVCTLVGLPTVTYHLLVHSTERVSGDPELRQESFRHLVQKHRRVFETHPRMFAEFVYKHALKSHEMGQEKAALRHLFWALTLAPLPMAKKVGREVINKTKEQVRRYFPVIPKPV